MIDTKLENKVYYEYPITVIKGDNWEMDNSYIPKLVRAALNNDKKNIEAISLQIGRKMKKEDPEIAAEIMKILSFSNSGADVTRSLDIAAIPRDKETRTQLVQIEEPIFQLDPILDQITYKELEDFIKERGLIEVFLNENVIPPNSILLHGKPGVGKTYIARWIAYKLNMPMITLDLANSISSYLGRSGQNIKRIFDYTKEQNVVLFLDEIDAIAKRRDDASDLGELKRLVNVLLKELEDCPVTCVIVGATNHPELLDKAIWRRFDRAVEVKIPKQEQRAEIIHRSLGERTQEISQEVLNLVIDGMKTISAADLCKFCEHVKRKKIMNDRLNMTECFLRVYCSMIDIDTKEQKKAICKELRKGTNKLTIKQISEITGIAQSSVDRYLKE